MKKATATKIKQFLPHQEVFRLISTHQGGLLREMNPFIVVDGKEVQISIDEVTTAPFIPEAGIPSFTIILKVTTESGNNITLKKEKSDRVFFYREKEEHMEPVGIEGIMWKIKAKRDLGILYMFCEGEYVEVEFYGMTLGPKSKTLFMTNGKINSHPFLGIEVFNEHMVYRKVEVKP